MIDNKALEKMTYGLYLISARSGDAAGGCVVNTFSQVTASPAQFTVAIHKENYTAELIAKSGFFVAVALAQSATVELMGKYGFHSGKDTDKFSGYQTAVDENEMPYLTEQVVARYSCKIVNCVDLGTHLLFVGELVAAETLQTDEPMSYAYYHTIKNGATPPKASTYQEKAVTGYRCKICGYILESDTLPADFICPICKRGADQFEKITAE